VDALFELRSYAKHLFAAVGPHGVHSPLVFDMLTKVLRPEKQFYCFEQIEKQRGILLNDHTCIDVNDPGAGSRKLHNRQRVIRDIARHALQSEHCAQQLFRITHHFKPTRILELGTSLGITTSYLASVDKTASVVSIEGVAAVADVAKGVFSRLGLSNIDLITGKFDEVLNDAFSKLGQVDLALIDGDHRYEATVQYFKRIAEHCHDNSIIILDDIHWSKGMHDAWLDIIRDERVMVSIDFFHFGVLFFKRDRERENFRLHLP